MKINDAGFYLLRTPVFSISRILEFNATNPSNEEASVFFSTLLKEKIFLESIYIASPEFYAQLLDWNKKPANAKDQEKMLLSLYKYFIRMCSRCTPYGLFAGCSMGTIGNKTSIQLGGLEKSRRNVRLDMNYVSEVVEYLLQIDQVKENSLFYANSSIYQIAEKYRYLEYRIIERQRMYYLTQVSVNPYLEKVLQQAKKGATISSMVSLLCQTEEVTNEEASEFIEQLIQSQLLISEFELMITGDEYFDYLLDKMTSFPDSQFWLKPFLMVNKILKSPSPSIPDYLQIGRLLRPILPDTNAKDLIQVDLFNTSVENEINATFINDLTKSFEKLYKINFLAESADLQEFKTAFIERYESREIPLMDALDPETGIGYGKMNVNNTDFTPLIDDINFANTTEEKWQWTKMRHLQMTKIFEASANRLEEIQLTEAEIDEMTDPAINFADSLYIHGLIYADNKSEKESLNFVLIHSAGPSGASLLGRFCHGDKELSKHVTNYLKEEEQHHPGHIYAEIVHLPQSRVGNILMRPFLRNYEIVYLGNSVLEADKQIRIDDLLISIYNGEIILRSKKFRKQVIPRLTTAHAFANGNLSVYKFLCDLQFQKIMPGISWNWGPFGSLVYLPRVRYKNIILSRQTWNLFKKEFEVGKNSNKDQVITKLIEIIKKLGIPKLVLLVDGDNELLLDTECRLSLKILAENALKRNVTTLVEFFNAPENCIVNGADGRYTGEFIFPLKKEIPRNQVSKWNHTLPDDTSQHERIFIPGSEWFYIKIYCGTSTCEKILAEVIKPLCEEFLETGIIDKWFFIRYYDPKPHIRVRFHNAIDPDFINKIQQELYPVLDSFIKSNLIFNYQVDTYVREVERYSAEAITLSEDLFFCDSTTVVDFLAFIEGQEGETLRWLYTIKGIDMLLDDFKCSAEFKLEILSDLQNSFFNEFGSSPQLKRMLDIKYRSATKAIAEVLSEDPLQFESLEETAPLLALFVQRSLKAKPVVDKILLIASEKDPYYLKDLIFSYIHMFVNRMFISSQRKHEMVIYHYMKKYYSSKIAQAKNKNMGSRKEQAVK